MDHPSSRSHIARSSVIRLEKDIDDFGSDENSASVPVIPVVDAVINAVSSRGSSLSSQISTAVAKIEQLRKLLQTLRQKDGIFVSKSVKELTDSVNGDGCLGAKRPRDMPIIRHQFFQAGGMEAILGFDFLVLCTATKDWSGNLRLYNPFLTEQESEDILSGVLLTMMSANRVSQTNLALGQVKGVLRLLNELNKVASTMSQAASKKRADVICKELSSSVLNLATTLAARREFSKKDPNDSSAFVIDPRFMLFEFSHNILLRIVT